MARRVWLSVMVVAVLALAGCGASPTPTSPGATSSGGGGGGGTPGPVATTPGGGAGGDDPCALLASDEVAGALGTDPLTAAGSPGDPANCRYTLADGEEALVFDVLRSGAATTFQSFVDAGSGESVDGLGDAAWYETSSRRLLVRSGDYLLMFFSRLDGLEASSAMARIVVARLTTGIVPPELQITPPPVISAETACDLLSAEEAASVIGKGPMEAQANEFAPQFCTYAIVSSGEIVLSTYLDAKGGQAAWQTFTGSLTTEPVDGLGQAALFEPSTGILFALQGDSVLNVNVFGQSPEAALELDRRLMEIMLGHL